MSNIKKDIVVGVFWSAVEKYSVFFVNIAVSMILARLLAPEEFGVVAIATVFIQFLSILSTMGIGTAVIQRRDLSQNDLNCIFTFSAALGLVLALLFFFLSGFIADFYQNVQLVSICQILSISVFFGTMNMVPAALMAKNKRFKEIARYTIILQFFVGCLAVFAAYHKMGVYALLISPIVTSIAVFFVNSHYYPVRVTTKFSLQPIKKIFSYSFFQFAFEFVNFFSRNLDKLIVGKILTSEALGYYDKSYRLMQMPAGQLTGVINPVLQPVMSTLQNQKQEMAVKYNKIIKFIGSISIPLSIYLFFVGPELIRFFFGNNWDPAIRPFQILSISLASQMILSTSGSIWQSCNATNYLFGVGLMNTIVTITGFVFAAVVSGSIEAIALAWSITAFINFFTTYTIMYKRVLKSSFFEMLRGLSLPLLNGILIFGIMSFLSLFCSNMPMVMFFCLKTILSIVVTLFFLIMTKQLSCEKIRRSFF